MPFNWQKAIPQLRGFAIYLTRDQYRADDLVQETLLRSLDAGTISTSKLIKIMREIFWGDENRR